MVLQGVMHPSANIFFCTDVLTNREKSNAHIENLMLFCLDKQNKGSVLLEFNLTCSICLTGEIQYVFFYPIRYIGGLDKKFEIHHDWWIGCEYLYKSIKFHQSTKNNIIILDEFTKTHF